MNMEPLDFLQYMVELEHDQIDKLLDKLSDADLILPLSARENEEDTIGSRLAHAISAEYRMATYLYKDDNDDPNFSINDKSVEDIKAAAQKSKERHLLTLQKLEPNDLDKEWTSEKSGNTYEYKFLLWHFIEHIATHRGQVAMAVNAIN